MHRDEEPTIIAYSEVEEPQEAYAPPQRTRLFLLPATIAVNTPPFDNDGRGGSFNCKVHVMPKVKYNYLLSYCNKLLVER